MLVQVGTSTTGASFIAIPQPGFSGNGAKHHGIAFAVPNCGSMSTYVDQYDFSIDAGWFSPTHSPRITAAERMKLDGSLGPENSGVMNDHTTISENSAAPTKAALRAAEFFTMPARRRFVRRPPRPLVLVTNTCLGLALQRFVANDRERLW